MTRKVIRDARQSLASAREEAELWEVLLLFVALPLVLLAVEVVIRSNFSLLTGFNRNYFRFPLTVEPFWSPRVLWKALISSYAHDTFHPHLTGNLTIYLLTMATLYPLSLLADRKREFSFILTFSLLVVPFITSYQSLQILPGQTTIGFSGVVGAFLGALPVVLVAAAGRRSEIELVPLWTAGPAFVILGGLAALAEVTNMIILSGLMAMILGTITVLYLGWRDLFEGLHQMMSPSNPFSWWGVTMAIIGPYALFFAIAPGTNIIGHLAGYFSGYAFAFLVVWDPPELTIDSLRPSGE